MVVRVAERAKLSAANQVYIATDDGRIMAAAANESIPAILTKTTHTSGTERLSEAVEHIGLDDDAIIVNVQGDEPFIDPLLINQLAAHLHSNPDLPVATACHLITEVTSAFNPNVVKVVLDKNNHALYFSRASIPYARDTFDQSPLTHLPTALPMYHHIGIYAYRAGFLREYQSFSASLLEQFETLEQLRILWHGFRIGVIITPTAPAPGIDTPDDLHKAKQIWQQYISRH
jgi:3-deoxy-manno-octulosonate cytidylyltransferase (CMP-KDO synthetase)